MPVTGWSDWTSICLPAQQSDTYLISKVQIDLPRGKQWEYYKNPGISSDSWFSWPPWQKCNVSLTGISISWGCFKDRLEHKSWAVAIDIQDSLSLFLGHIPWAQRFNWEFLSTWKYNHLGKHQNTPMEQTKKEPAVIMVIYSWDCSPKISEEKVTVSWSQHHKLFPQPFTLVLNTQLSYFLS